MHIEEGIRNLLLASPEIAAMVGERIAPYMIDGETVPSEVPAITFALTYERPLTHSLGQSFTMEGTLELTSWVAPTTEATGYTLARKLGREIRKALAGKTYEAEDGSLSIQEITEDSTSTNPPDSPADLWSVDSIFSLIYDEIPKE